MKVLFLAPWFRTLAVGWADGLRERGHDVRVVTTTQHFDPPPVHERDIVFSHRWRTPAGACEEISAFGKLRAWSPDVVISDPVSDPRYTLLSMTGRRQIVVTHDARPHDEVHKPPVLRRINTVTLMQRADAEVVFSGHVADILGDDRGHPVHVLPLMSEMPEEAVPPFVPASQRHDFVVIGRLSRYKNVATIVRAYEEHRASASYRGDRLVVIGGGDPGCVLPDSVMHLDGRFKFREVAPLLAAAKASVCLYSAGSQSGVQVWAMQCGTASLVGEVGALGEYLPAGESVIAHDDAPELARRFAELADPDEAERRGRAHRAEYDRRLTPDAVASEWERVLEMVDAGGRRGRR